MADDPLAETGSAAPAATPQQEAKDILARYGGAPAQDPGQGAKAPGMDPQAPGGQPSADPSVVTGKVLVQWGETQREVDIADLVRQARDVENAQAVQQASREELAKLGIFKALEETKEQWSPERRENLERLLREPSLLDRLGQPPAPRHDDDNDYDLDTRPPGQPAPKRAADPDIDLLKRGMHVLLQREHEREQSAQHQDLESRVVETLRSFSPLKHDPGALHSVKGWVMDHMILNPRADLAEVAAQAATTVLALAEGKRRSAENGDPGPGALVTRPVPAQQFSGSQVSALMASGQSADVAYQRYLELSEPR